MIKNEWNQLGCYKTVLTPVLCVHHLQSRGVTVAILRLLVNVTNRSFFFQYFPNPIRRRIMTKYVRVVVQNLVDELQSTAL